MIVNVDSCSACGTGHKQQEILRDGSGQHYFVCERRVSAAHPDGVPVYVAIESAPTEPELEAHRQRLQALMKEAVAPLLARIDAAEAKAAEAEEASREIARRLQEERDRKEEARIAEARARFRLSLAAELVVMFDQDLPVNRMKNALEAADQLLKLGDVSW